jgi:predicted DNA-binding transcriptional regulator AlpA
MPDESRYAKAANDNAASSSPRGRQNNRLPIAPRGLSRGEAATYIGVSQTFFDKLVREGLMPTAKRIGARRVWDRFELDDAFDALSANDDVNPWDAAVSS